MATGTHAGKPRVAHVTTVDLSLRYLLLNQLQRIQQEGYEVFGISADGPDVMAVEAAGIPHFAVPMTRRFTPLADLRALWSLVRVMRRERFDLVHTHTPKAGLLGQMAARMAGVPVVANTLHGFYFHDDMKPLPRRFYVWMERIAAKCSDTILSQNREDIATAVAEGIASADLLKWLGNGIDLQRFDRRRISKDNLDALRTEIGIDATAPVIGFVGRLVEEKGILDLLQAAKAVVEAIPNAQFLIVGPYDEEKPDALRPKVAERYGVAAHCRFVGMRDDMPELYALMDVLALPSYREGFPRAPMEASAMGVPAVVTDIRGCREAVDHGENGLLFPVGDADQLARSLIELLQDDERRTQMGIAGRRIAEHRFDEQQVFDRVLSEYARLLR
ncbi:MAG: glycosyltransferase family 4 protein [Myxococcales bacterium]|nr:glycosyltransferase family 4 protein [Myxococcales bacterium]MDH3485715.1 glycosyltransferase family 4 protein [Myxococcales bacterium]